MREFKPEGWGPVIIPTSALYGGYPRRPGFGRGPFGMFDYTHEDAGETAAKSGARSLWLKPSHSSRIRIGTKS